MAKITGSENVGIPLDNLKITAGEVPSEKTIELSEIQSNMISMAISNRTDFSLPGIGAELTLDRFELANQDIASSIRSLAWAGSSMVCTMNHDLKTHETFEKIVSRELDGQPWMGQVGEYNIEATTMLFLGTSTNIDFADSSICQTLTMAAHHWVINSSKRNAICWVGLLEDGIHFNNRYNLRIATKSNRTPQGLGLFLHGNYDYCVLFDKKLLVIMPTDEKADLDLQKLANDQTVLSFVLGQRISIARIVGIDSQGAVCSERQCLKYHSSTEAGCRLTPVPTIELDGRAAADGATWLATFFRKCSQALRDHPEYRLDMALVTYVDSLSGDLIPAYLRIQVQIEALAFHLLTALKPEHAKSKLVKSFSAWKKFVSELIKPRLQEFALDATAANDLFTKIDSAPKHVSGKRVRDVFKHFKIDLFQNTLDEIEERDNIVHAMEISKERDGAIKVEREVSRIKMMQTLLVALIALAAGYRGKIRQWARPLGQPSEGAAEGSVGGNESKRPWWEIDGEQENDARNFYIALV